MKQEQHFHHDMFKIFVGYNNIITVAGVNVMLCYVFLLSAISPYTLGLKALFNQSDCTGTAPTHK